MQSFCYPCTTTGKKTVSAKSFQGFLKIDGYLNEVEWDGVPVASDFIQYEPYNGRPSIQKTEVKFIYSDKAIYVGAKMFDSSPDSLFMHLGKRDELGIADYFGVYFDPYNDSKTAYSFRVSCSGVQADLRLTMDGNEDYSWDAVWKSKARLTEYGWIAEMEIPYSALRFPQKEQHVWGVNIIRSIQRANMITTWNFIDKEKSGELNQAGELHGIERINPSIRLSFTPFFSSYLEYKSAENKWSSILKGGLDLKYGISESFTLDMVLIPDFGQVESDDEQLNLSPFELFYEEKRPFFMEGTELFDKAGIFYSRRIGTKRFDIFKDTLKDNETVVNNPQRNQLVNLSKISGKFKKGLSIGFLNGITSSSYATLKDTLTEEKRKVRAQAFTNYNVTVLDQSIGKNSYVSLINTNVNRTEDNYIANTTGTEFNFANAKNSYAISGNAAMSQIWDKRKEDEFGHKYRIKTGKVSGKFKYDFTHWVESDTYNPNDLGFIARNNEVGSEAFIHYNIYEPKWILQSLQTDFSVSYYELFKPRNYVNLVLRYWLNLEFKDNSKVQIHVGGRPQEMVDYFESRVWGWKFKRPRDIFISMGYNSDWTKKFSYELTGNFNRQDYKGHRMLSLYFEPIYRVGNRLRFELLHSFQGTKNDLGFVEYNENNQAIYFGKRNIKTVENRINISYGINNKTSFDTRIRHYWSSAAYTGFYTLKRDGYLEENNRYGGNPDVNFNAFTVDMALKWNFAPGSELSLVFKNLVQEQNNDVGYNYFKNFKNIFDLNNANSISMRVLYYIDFLQFKKSILNK